ncbi:MAG: TetR/AcrR family transcriptional regulator, partial [Chloroflexota bacterium]
MVDNSTSTSRERVLDMAEQLFRERGYHTVTMHDIATALGMRRASLYYHAPQGKEQLFLEVMERVFTHHHNGLETAIAQTEPQIEPQLRAVLGWFASQPPLFFQRMIYADMPLLDEEHLHQLANLTRECIVYPIRDIFINAFERGEIQMINPDTMVSAFIAQIDGIFHINQRVY